MVMHTVFRLRGHQRSAIEWAGRSIQVRRLLDKARSQGECKKIIRTATGPIVGVQVTMRLRASV
jgi:hypothetical protein